MFCCNPRKRGVKNDACLLIFHLSRNIRLRKLAWDPVNSVQVFPYIGRFPGSLMSAGESTYEGLGPRSYTDN